MGIYTNNESINYGETAQIVVSDFGNLSITPMDSVINITQSGNTYTIDVNPRITTLYIVTGTDVFGNSLNTSITIYVNVTVINSTVNTDFNTPITLTAYGSNTYQWTPPDYLNTTTSNSVVSIPLKNITYTIQGTDIYNVVTITYLTVNVNTFLEFTPKEPVVLDGNLLEISVQYNNPNSNILPDMIRYIWTSNLFINLPNNCIYSNNNSSITLHPYNSGYYTVNAFNVSNATLLSSNTVNIKVIPKTSNIIDVDIIPYKLKDYVFNKNKKALVKALLDYKSLTKKIINFYYTTLQFAYRYEFTNKNGIPFKVQWITYYQIKQNSNEMILSFEQQWKFFKYINQNKYSNFKYLLNTINEVFLEKPQQIRLMPLGTTTYN